MDNNLKLVETKLCKDCKEIKNLIDFDLTPSFKPKSKCRECRKKQYREYSKTNRSKSDFKFKKSNYRLLKTYGITIEEKQNMLIKQNNKCAICTYEFKDLSNAHIDHNHETNKVRDLLCSNCNTAIGLLKEDKKRIENIRFYLAKHDNNYTDLSKFASYLKEREGVDLIETKEGYATYIISEEECLIKDIYVSPEYRKQHIASKIANKIVEKAQEVGCKYLTGTVCPSANNSTISIKILLSYGMRLHSSQPNFIIFIKDI